MFEKQMSVMRGQVSFMLWNDCFPILSLLFQKQTSVLTFFILAKYWSSSQLMYNSGSYFHPITAEM